MIIYIALLRGINVGGKNMIKMADLKHMFEALGLCRVETYIQSGNIIFESEENEETLRVMIENAITKLNGSSIAVILRTATELEQIIQDCP
ncbi:MAG: cytoplasmic protein, partial [Pelosinus sp.]|nr:cytoplasmic protein [Pelosinus sp.]